MKKVALNYNKLTAIILAGAVVYNEYLAYYSSYLSWPAVPADLYAGDFQRRCDSSFLRILLVADAQIQGYLKEGLFGAVRRWDADRYLRKNFVWAVTAYDPNVVVFLGDLLDEGSETDDNGFNDYVTRFRSIYGLRDENGRTICNGDVKCEAVFVAGDNDIGGEGRDLVTQEKVSRFIESFAPKEKYTFGCSDGRRLQIVPVNMILSQLEEGQDAEEWFKYHSVSNLSQDVHRMVISHLPITPSIGRNGFANYVIKHLKPSVIFSAHDHHGMDVEVVGLGSDGSNEPHIGNVTKFSLLKNQNDEKTLERQNSFRALPLKLYGEGVTGKFDLLHEVVVPTCSYRMGEKEMAFGFGFLNLDDKMSNFYYANLWLPSRFKLLFVYLVAVVISTVMFLLGTGKHLRRGPKQYPSSWKRRRLSTSPSSKSQQRGRSRSREKCFAKQV